MMMMMIIIIIIIVIMIITREGSGVHSRATDGLPRLGAASSPASVYRHACTPNLPIKNFPAEICRLKTSGKFPVDMRIPSLKIKILLGSTPLKSRILVRRLAVAAPKRPASLRTKILDFRGVDSSIILIFRGGILMSMGEFPGSFESGNLSRDNLSREIGRSSSQTAGQPAPASLEADGRRVLLLLLGITTVIYY